MSGQNPFQVSHPAHLTSIWSSALIPFCAYKTHLNMSEHLNTVPGISFPLCSSFLPTLLDGQLCYKLKLNRSSGEGRQNQLMLVLDSNEDRSLHPKPKSSGDDPSTADQSKWIVDIGSPRRSLFSARAKTSIGTLSSNSHFGRGICTMTVVKRMSAKADFLGMPLSERKCSLELYEECRTRKLLEECNCVPWEMPGYQVGALCEFDSHPNVQAGNEDM